ncbi:hypothetical protein ACXR6G_02295 [Ancylomarina sp. YFZ004]
MKKKIPLAVHKALERLTKLRGEYFEVTNPDNFLLKVVDIDKDSDFYFNIEAHKLESEYKLLIDMKPQSDFLVTNRRTWIPQNQIENHFKNWVHILKGYEVVDTFYDDPILKSFENDYYAEFELIDEEDKMRPLNPKHILSLDRHLELIENNIDNYQTEKNKIQIQEIKTEVKDIRSNLTLRSKEWIAKRLSKVWAKLTKHGTPIIKEFLTEAKRTAITEGIKFITELASQTC